MQRSSSLRFAVIAAVFFCMAIVPSMQYGTVLTDNVVPIKNDLTYIQTVDSQIAKTDEFDPGRLSVSDPAGFVAAPARPLEVHGSSFSIDGELGAFLGGRNTDHINLDTTGDFVNIANRFDLTTEDFSVTAGDDINFNSGSTFTAQTDQMVLEGIFGWAVESELGNVLFKSQVEVNVRSDELRLSGEDNLSLNSALGEVALVADEDLTLNAENFHANSIAGTQLASRDLSLSAGNGLYADAGFALFRSFQEMTFTSTQDSVEFNAADAISVKSESAVNLNGADVIVTTSEDADSNVEIVSSTGKVAFSATTFTSTSKNVVFQATKTNNINVDDLTVNGRSEVRVGTSQTVDEIDFNSGRNTVLSSSNLLDVNALTASEFDFRSKLTSSAGRDLRYTASDISLAAKSIINTGNGAFFSVAKFQELVTAQSVNLTSSGVSSLSGKQAVFTAVAGSTTATIAGNYAVTSKDDLRFFAPTNSFIAAKDFSVASEQVRLSSVGAVSFTAAQGSIQHATVDNFNLISNDDITFAATGNIAAYPAGDYRLLAKTTSFFQSGLSTTFSANQDVTTNVVGNWVISDVAKLVSVTAADTIFFNTNSFFAADADNGTPGLSITSGVTVMESKGTLSYKNEGLFTVNGANLIADSLQSALTISSINTAIVSTGATTADSAHNFAITSNLLNFASASSTVRGTHSNTIDANTDLKVEATNSGNILLEADGSLSVSATQDISVTASAGDLVFATDLRKQQQDTLSFNSITSTTFKSNSGVSFLGGSVSFDAASDIVFDSNLFVSSALKNNSNTLIDAGNAFSSQSKDLVMKSVRDFDIQNTNPFSVIFSSKDATTIDSSDFTAFKSLQETTVTAVKSATFKASDIDLQAFNTSSATFIASTLQHVTASKQVNFISEDSSFLSSETYFKSVASQSIDWLSNNSVAFRSYDANAKISLKAKTNPTDDIFLSSGGSATFHTQTNDILISSDFDYDVTAGRSYQMWSEKRGFEFDAKVGNFVIESSADVIIEARENIYIKNTDLINGDPPIGTADIRFVVENRTAIYTEDGGVLLRGYATLKSQNEIFDLAPVLAEVAKPGAVVQTTHELGNIIFETNNGPIAQLTRDRLSFISGGDQNYHGTDGIDVNTQVDISFTGLEGNFDINAENGISYTAGTDGNPADITLTLPNGDLSILTAQDISFTTRFPTDDGSASINIQSDAAKIRYATANSGNITFVASDALSFTAKNDFVVNATRDFRVQSISGGLTLDAKVDNTITSNGGPIEVQTKIGSPGGAIVFDSDSANIRVQSGGSFIERVEQQILFQAQRGALLEAKDGRLDVAARSTGAFINLISASSMSIRANGIDTAPPADGVYFTSQYNLNVKTPLNLGISSVERVNIGTFTRPTVRFNAGGNQANAGFKLTAQGGISASTENTFTLNALGSFNLDVENTVQFHSNGPTTIATTGTSALGQNIELRAAEGSLSLRAGHDLIFQSTDSWKATTSGIATLLSTGYLPNAGISLSAGTDIHFTAAQTLEFNNQVLDADLTSSILYTASSKGTVETQPGSNGNIFFNSDNTFQAVNNDGLGITVRTVNNEAPLRLVTKNDGSTINFTTKDSSDIEILASGAVRAGAKTTTFTATNGNAVIQASNTLSTELSDSGFIESFATGAIRVDSNRDLTVFGNHGVLLSTRGIVDDIGAPIFLTATDRISFGLDTTNPSGDEKFKIVNTRNEGGNIDFFAARNLRLDTEKLTFYADGDFITSSVSTTTFEGPAGTLTQRVKGDYSATASGSQSQQNYGILFSQTNAAVQPIQFNAFPESSIEIFGETGVTFTYPNSVGTDVSAEISFSHIFDVVSQGNMLLSALNTIDISNIGGNSTIEGATAVTFNSALGNFRASVDGRNGDGLESLKFYTPDSNVIVTTPSLTFNSERFATAARTISISSATELEIQHSSPDGRTVFDASGVLHTESVFDSSFTVTKDILVQTNGIIRSNASETTTITSVFDIVILTSESAIDAEINAIAEGDVFITTTQSFIARSLSPAYGSSVNVQSVQARIDSFTDALGTNINIVGTAGNVTIQAENQGDVLIGDPALNVDVVVNTHGGFNVFSGYIFPAEPLTIQGTSVAINTNGGDFDLTSNRDLVITNPAQTLTISTRAGSATHNADNEDIILSAAADLTTISNTINFRANTGVEGLSRGHTKATFRGANGASFLFDGTVTRLNDAQFAIPFTSDPSVRSGSTCNFAREIIFAVDPASAGGYLCVCDPYGGTQTTGSLNWVCRNYFERAV